LTRMLYSPTVASDIATDFSAKQEYQENHIKNWKLLCSPAVASDMATDFVAKSDD
jgi:hypothetical protein